MSAPSRFVWTPTGPQVHISHPYGEGLKTCCGRRWSDLAVPGDVLKRGVCQKCAVTVAGTTVTR